MIHASPQVLLIEKQKQLADYKCAAEKWMCGALIVLYKSTWRESAKGGQGRIDKGPVPTLCLVKRKNIFQEYHSS